MLSTITVNTTNDQQDVSNNATSVGNTVSLRDAVIVATNTSGATEIDVPVGLYNLGNVGTGELQVGNIAGQTITIKGLGTAANTIINQTVAGNRLFNYDNNQVGSLAGSLLNLTIQGATNVNRLFGGGAILAGGPGDSLALTNCVVQNNSTSNGTLNIGRNGGGISYSGGGNLTISNCVFSNDTAGGSSNSGSAGGAIEFNNSGAGNLTISNSTFSNNKATGVPGSLGGQAEGGALLIAGSGTVSITSSTFTGNSVLTSAGGTVAGQGGAISASSMNFTISASRFFNDTAVSGGGIEYADAVITANDNWWGANAFPNGPGTDTVAKTNGGQGSFTAFTRLALALSPASSSIATNSSTTLTAKIVSATTSTTGTTAVTGTALEGLSLTFAPGTLGSVNPTSVAISGGTAGTTFSSASTFGTTNPTVTLDNGSKSTTITIVGAPTANSQSVNVAHNTAKGITLTGSDPNTPARSLTYTIATNPTHGSLSGTAPNLTYTPAANYQGTDSFTFTDSNGTATSNTATVTLTVAAGTPTANAQSVGVNQGSSAAITLAGSDPDVPALPLTYAIATNPSHGTLSGFNASTGAVTYTPTAGYSGADNFTFTVNNGTNTSSAATVSLTVSPTSAAVSGTVGVSWGTAGTATLQTNADGLRLLPTGRNTDLPWLGVNKLSITLSQPATLVPSDISVVGINIANYAPVTLSGSGTSYTITLAQAINAADRVTVTIGNAGVTTFTRRLDVLPGDFNDDGGVTMQDAIAVRNEFLGISGAVPTVFGDINGDGVVDVNDYNAVRKLLGTNLP